jgi:hypothetical protein
VAKIQRNIQIAQYISLRRHFNAKRRTAHQDYEAKSQN